MKLAELLKEDMVDRVEFAEEIANILAVARQIGVPRVKQEINALFQRYIGMKPSEMEDQNDMRKMHYWLNALSPEELAGMLYKAKAIVDKQASHLPKRLRKTMH